MENYDIVDTEMVLGLDQTLPMEIAQRNLLERIDEIIQRSVEEGNPDIASNAMKSLLGIARIAGLGLAKAYYTFKYQWPKYKRNETFDDYLDDTLGKKKVTVKRYIRVWEMLVSGDIPTKYIEQMKLQPIRCLIAVATLYAEDYDIPENKWRELANAPDPSTVNKLCREIKGLPPRKNSLQLEIDAEGSIYAWSDGKRYYVGFLKRDDESEVVQKAITRIMSDKILEK